MRTAIIRGLRPTTLLLHKQPYSKWNDLDFILLPAYQRYEDEISSSTGLPLWLSRSRDTDITFRVVDDIDRGQEALDDWDEKHAKDKKKGVTRIVVPFTADGEPLEYGGLTRERYRLAAIQEAQDLAEGIELERDRPEGGYNPADYGDGMTNPA